jgi:four helix bundle protein
MRDEYCRLTIGDERMNSAELKQRTKVFAHRCIRLSTALPKTPVSVHISGQLIRSSTSVAANYRAACRAQSKAGFVSKISIVLEEVDESLFWLEFIVEEKLLPLKRVEMLIKEADELTAIFTTTRKTARVKSIENRKSKIENAKI